MIESIEHVCQRKPVTAGMSQQQQAEFLAEQSLIRFGFVVVGYKTGKEPKIGEITRNLWRVFIMPQPFVVVRQATPDEWRRQVALLSRPLY